MLLSVILGVLEGLCVPVGEVLLDWGFEARLVWRPGEGGDAVATSGGVCGGIEDEWEAWDLVEGVIRVLSVVRWVILIK